MPVIHLVRHGQASFGTDDYDRLSDLGRVQATLAGRELARRGIVDPVIISGTLERQRDTAALVAAEVGAAKPVMSTDHIDGRLDEFDGHALIEAHLGQPGITDGMSSLDFQVHLDEAMLAWMHERPESWNAFAGGALEAVRALAERVPHGHVGVACTSAGVTGAIVSQVLHAGPETAVALNRVSINASITTLLVGSRGTSLLTFNDHAHLAANRAQVTYR